MSQYLEPHEDPPRLAALEVDWERLPRGLVPIPFPVAEHQLSGTGVWDQNPSLLVPDIVCHGVENYSPKERMDSLS